MSKTNNQRRTSGVTKEDALEVSKYGYPVFPLWPDTKKPATDHGFYDGTTVESEVHRWPWERRGMAIATGLASRLVVIEADGPVGVAYLREKYGEPTVWTRNGAHWYRRYPGDKTPSGPLTHLQETLGTDEDIHCKGDGGYVECPPSGSKRWTNDIPDRSTLPPLPPELRKPKRDTRKQGARALPDEQIEAGAEIIARHVADLRGGTRHQHLKDMCGALLPRMEHDAAEIMLVEAWTKVSDELAERAPREVANTLRTTAEALEDGNATGIPSMEKLTPGLFDELAKALGLDEQASETEEDRRRIKEKAAEEAWAVCEPLAKSDDILSEVYALQQQDGLVGEETNAKIMQLVSATRHKGKPMSIIVNGESSGGKSFLLKETIKTLPDEAVHVLQSISDKALAYIGENTLTDKFLLIYELGGLGKEGEQGLEMIKQLLTEGRIDRQIAESVQGKGVRGRRVYAEGPTGLWTTTTKNVLDRELQNRALSLTIDESPRQTELIIKGRKNRKKRGQVDFSSIKALHTWLAAQGGDVDIPYEDVIADGVDTRAVRMRRFYDYIMELVEAHALMHRANRVQDVDGFVLAKPEDYAAVYKLVKDYVAVAAEVGVSHGQRETVEAARLIIDSDKPLTRSTLAEKLDISESSASRRLGSATCEGYLKHDPDAKGKTKVYVMGDISLPDETTPAIPSPEDIEEAARGAYDDACNRAMRAHTPSPSDADAIKSEVSRANPQCTHDAHMDPEENGSSQNPHTYGESSNSAETENEDFGPSVHALHTCTHQENGHERANVHAAVQGAVHASEGGDTPKVEYDPGHHENFCGLTPNDQLRLLAWIRSRFTPHPWLRLKVGFLRDSYNFKALFERSENGFYIDNGTFKGAMLAAGFEPVASDDGYPCGLEELMFDEDWSFRGKLKYYFEWLPTVEQQEWALEAIRGWGHPVRVGVAAKQRQIPRAKVGKLTEVLLYLEQEGWARFRDGGWEPTYRVPYPSQRSLRPSGGSSSRAGRVNND